MRQALDDDDIAFLQKWFGLALLGKNKSQVIVILSGTAQGGKSTLVNIVSGVIGKDNIATLRTEQLGQRFETASFLGKTLLHGADVPADFLTHKSAVVLKSLTGGDSMTVELKNGRERPEIEGNFNVSPRVFVNECFVKADNSRLTQDDCFEQYLEFCKKREWTPLPRTTANPIIENQIMRLYAVSQRNDISIAYPFASMQVLKIANSLLFSAEEANIPKIIA